MKESKLQSLCIKQIAPKHGWLGIKLLPFQTKGLPDCFFIGHGKVLFVEFKTESGVISKVQKYMHDKFNEYDIEVHIIKTVDEFNQLLYRQTPREHENT